MNGRPEQPTIKGVIFDFGGVIHSVDTGIFFRSLQGGTGKTLAEMAALVAVSDLPRRYESGRISSREFFRGVSNLCGLSISEEEFLSAFVAIFAPIEPTIRLIRDLSRSYRLGLLSNTNEWHFDHHIRRVDVFGLFDAVTLSFEVKVMKPAEEIYRDSLEKIGLRPQECVFIDDLEENVAGARRINLQAIRYTGHDRLVSSLADLGIVP